MVIENSLTIILSLDENSCFKAGGEDEISKSLGFEEFRVDIEKLDLQGF